jgi:hypothetical protein
METGVARVSAWGEMEQRKKKGRLGFVQGSLYCTGARLVTPSSKEEAPALRRRGARRRAVHHARKRMRTISWRGFFLEGVCWAGLGCTAGCCWAGVDGCWWAANWAPLDCSDLLGKPLFFLIFFFCFYFSFCIFSILAHI